MGILKPSESVPRLYDSVREHTQILSELALYKTLNFSQDNEGHKRLQTMRNALIQEGENITADSSILSHTEVEFEVVKLMLGNVLNNNRLLLRLSKSGALKFYADNESQMRLLWKVLKAVDEDMKIMEPYVGFMEVFSEFYTSELQALREAVIEGEPAHTEAPQEEPEVKEPEEAVHTTVAQEEPEVKEPEEPAHTEAPQEEAGESTVKKSEYSFYDDFGIDIGAIRFLMNMSDEILLKTEVFLKRYIEQCNKVTGFKLSNGFILNYRYKKAQHIVYDWLESIRKTGSLSPLEDEDDEEMQWLYFSSFHSIEEIRGMTSLIISSAYNVICPPPSKTKADRFQLGRWHCQKEIVLQAANAEIEEFGRYLWEKVKEV